jgi:hypothetical protein
VEEFMTVLTGTEPVRRPAREPNQPQPDRRGEALNLDGRYGEIGISAVAAALHFAGAAKNPAHALAAPCIDERYFEAAA